MTTIVIPCWNGVAHTLRCIDAVRRWTPEPHEIILVDNGSRDGTSRAVAEERRRWSLPLTILRNRANRGFAAAINQGTAIARGRFIVWLNNDALVTPDWLGGLLECARAPRVGAVGPRTNAVGGGGIQQIAPAEYGGPAGAARFARAWALHPGARAQFVPRLTGFCLLAPADAMRRVGPLDERFKLGGYEDLDYSLRLRRAGYRLALARRVFVHHEGHRSFCENRVPPARLRRNLRLFLEKWTSAGLDRLGFKP